MLKECEKCNGPFEAKRDNARFCSKKCYPRKIPVISAECPQCHQVREVHTWKVRGTCRDCASDRHSGPGSPTWRGGAAHWSPGRYGKDKDGLSWKTQRRLAWERDDETCQHCHTKKNRKPDVHHIVPFRVSQSHALDNLLCLCQSCHLIEEAKVQDQWGGQLTLGVDLKPRGPRVAKSSDRNLRWARINQFILDNYQKMSQAALAAELGITQPAVSLRFKRLGIHVDKGERRRHFLR